MMNQYEFYPPQVDCVSPDGHRFRPTKEVRTLSRFDNPNQRKPHRKFACANKAGKQACKVVYYEEVK